MSASTLQKMGTGEHLFPFLLAGLEACVVDIGCVGLANIGFLGSTDLLFPLWLPFLVIATACWILRYPTQRMLHTFPALHQQENERRSPQPLLALLCTLLLIELLFIVCTGIYAPFDLSWLTSATALTLQDLVRIVVFLGVAVFLCWCGVQIARSHVDTDSIGRNLRIVVVCLALIIVQRVVQELLYHDEMAHEDTALFFLVMLFACLSLFAYPVAQRVYLFRFHIMGMRETFKRHEYVFLWSTACFYLPALASLWYVIFMYNHWFVVGTRIAAPPPSSGRKTHFPFPKIPVSNIGPAKIIAEVSAASKIVFLICIGVIILVFVVRAIRRWLAQLPDDIHESTWSWPLFWSQLKGFIAAFFARFLPSISVEGEGEKNRANIQEEIISSEIAIHVIRELYRALLQQAKSTGYPRNRNETPAEYCKRLSQNFPFAEPQLSTITNTYVATRYGQYMPDEAEITFLQETWADLEQCWQENIQEPVSS